ncbi:MAG: SspB family protein [Pseudorhodoplanes sp.]
MAVDHIRYDLLTQDALRGVVRQVLSDTAKHGLVGDHHFYISFSIDAPGVQMSERLRAKYPEEITIVLQHEFWDLAVQEDRFEVGLHFGGIREHLVVPFAAVKGFFDPSVQFGLQFELATQADPQATGSDRSQPVAEEAAKPVPEQPPAADEKADSGQTSAEVVRLDRFRKK